MAGEQKAIRFFTSNYKEKRALRLLETSENFEDMI